MVISALTGPVRIGYTAPWQLDTGHCRTWNKLRTGRAWEVQHRFGGRCIQAVCTRLLLSEGGSGRGGSQKILQCSGHSLFSWKGYISIPPNTPVCIGPSIHAPYRAPQGRTVRGIEHYKAIFSCRHSAIQPSSRSMRISFWYWASDSSRRKSFSTFAMYPSGKSFFLSWSN